MSEYEPPKLGFVPPPPVLWAWRCPNDGTLHWLHVGRECHCGFLLANADPLAERDEARAQLYTARAATDVLSVGFNAACAQRDALAEALREWTDAFVAHHQAYDLEIEGDDLARLLRARAALEKARGI